MSKASREPLIDGEIRFSDLFPSYPVNQRDYGPQYSFPYNTDLINILELTYQSTHQYEQSPKGTIDWRRGQVLCFFLTTQPIKATVGHNTAFSIIPTPSIPSSQPIN
jgi:hypothetical protein